MLDNNNEIALSLTAPRNDNNNDNENIHKPVLLNEVIDFLNPQSGEDFVDGTVGLGGHALKILEKTLPNGKVLGIDQDTESLKTLKSRNVERLVLTQSNFVNLNKIVEENGFSKVDGVLLDLGISSWQLEKSGRGISFQKTELLDMRMDPENNELTAEEIVNTWSQEELERIFFEYGGEKFSRRIVRNIIEERKKNRIKTTYELVGLIIRAYPQRKVRKIHPATKVFQALRIAVNKELENLDKVLPQILEILKPSGRFVIISFHSAEDRIVKNFIRDNKRDNLLSILTKKPIVPTREEVDNNPRSRSAKLRAAVKI
ncbi:MAG: 16S rRNA (cytosine(1402)-N(4))-methyltransferase RsmH [bacterium]